MHSEQHFSLCWNDHHSTLVAIFESLLESGTLVDCTIAAEGQFLKAHRVVLSACSPYFQLLLSQQNENHPIIILKDVKFQELKAMIDYIYRGEVKISENRLGDFLEAAESLQIKGLGDGNIRDGLERAGLTDPHLSSTRRGTSAPTSRKRHHSSQANYQAYMGALPPHTNLPTHPNIGEEGPQELPPIPDVTMGGCNIPPSCQPSPSSLSNTPPLAISNNMYNRNTCTPMVTHVSSNDGSDINMKKEPLPTQMILEPKIEYMEKSINDNCVENLTMLYDMDEMAELKTAPPEFKTAPPEFDRSDSKASMLMHARPLRYTCAECNKAFPRASQLKIHQRTHTGERPYTCDVCTAAFKKSGDLKIHKRLHTGERPYPCLLCERAFISNSDLHKHKRVHGITPASSTRSAAAAAAAAAAAVGLLAQVSPGACSAAAAVTAAATPNEAATLS